MSFSSCLHSGFGSSSSSEMLAVDLTLIRYHGVTLECASLALPGIQKTTGLALSTICTGITYLQFCLLCIFIMYFHVFDSKKVQNYVTGMFPLN